MPTPRKRWQHAPPKAGDEETLEMCPECFSYRGRHVPGCSRGSATRPGSVERVRALYELGSGRPAGESWTGRGAYPSGYRPGRS